MPVTISRPLADRLVALASASADEVCGVLFGREDRVETILPAENVALDPSDSFEIDPVALTTAYRAEREGGPAIVGWYHSHPIGSADPSRRDAALADDDGRLWIIVAGGTLTGWRKRPSSVSFERVELCFPPV